MRDYRLQARTALKIYLDRGEKALEQFEHGKLDSFIKTLRLKSAAFHNFRAADGILAKQGFRTEDDPEIQGLWPVIRELDVKLAEALNAATLATREELRRNQRVRTSIGKYRSRALRGAGFERSI